MAEFVELVPPYWLELATEIDQIPANNRPIIWSICGNGFK